MMLFLNFYLLLQQSASANLNFNVKFLVSQADVNVIMRSGEIIYVFANNTLELLCGS